jgi:hypothetical protein
MSVAQCNLCPEDEKFKVPWDEIGVMIMKEHIKEKHPEASQR